MPRTLFLFAVALLLSLTAAAQDTWQLDPPHSSAQFSVRHLGVSTVRGAFTKVSGAVRLRCRQSRQELHSGHHRRRIRRYSR